MATKHAAAPAAADHAEVIDLVGNSGVKDEAQGMNTQRPSRINVKREQAVGSVVYDVDTNETDHSQDNNRSNGIDRHSIESVISTFDNAREMMEKKLKQLRQEWDACHERYKYACARGFYANDRDGREDRAIDNMRRIETDIDNLKAKLRNDQSGQNVAASAAAVTPVAQRNDELAEEAEMESSNNDLDDGFNNPSDDTQESSMEGPFHPLGMKPEANYTDGQQKSEETDEESGEEVEDDGSIEDAESDGNISHDESSSDKDDTSILSEESVEEVQEDSSIEDAESDAHDEANDDTITILSESEESSDEVEDESSIKDAESDSNLFHEESSHYEANNDAILPKSDESVEEVEDDSSTEDAESDDKTIDEESSHCKVNDHTTPSESKDSDEEVVNDSFDEDDESEGKSIHSCQNTDFIDSSKLNGENEEEAVADYAGEALKHTRGNEQSQATLDLIDVPYQRPIPSGDKSGTSRYAGVTFDNRSKKWRAQIEIDGKRHQIGTYNDEIEAAVDYARASFKYRGGKEQSQLALDLSDVPYQRPIPRDDKSCSSRYVGVTFSKWKNKWVARIKIDGKRHQIGTYNDEFEAAVDYARALFKYRGGNEQSQLTVDLSDVPFQRPIPRDDTSGTSRYVGVNFEKKRNNLNWRAQIRIDGKQCHIGNYYDETEAAVDYARALFKYRGGNEQRQLAVDLADVPYQRPFLRGDTSGTSRYVGVTFDKERKKWRAQIRIDGKKCFVGSYDDEEEAAVDFARATFKYRGGNEPSDSTKAAGNSMAMGLRAQDHVSGKRPSLQMKEAGGKGNSNKKPRKP